MFVQGSWSNRLLGPIVAGWALAVVVAVGASAAAPAEPETEAGARRQAGACLGTLGSFPAAAAHRARSRLSEVLGAAFVENRGQVGKPVDFYLPVGRDRVWITPRELVFDQSSRRRGGHAERLSFTQRLVGARTTRVEGRGRLPGHANFLRRGGGAMSAAGVGRFTEVVQRNAWRGIDVRLRAGDRTLEQDILVRPGADLRRVRIAYRGIRGLRVAPDGSLRIRTAFGVLREQRPVAYQIVDGRRQRVRARFRLLSARSYTFALARHRRDRPLVIDPVIAYARYLGGTGAAVDSDEVNDVAVDPQGNAYLTGETNSTDFTGADPARSQYKGGEGDAFVTKLSAAGDLVYTTYFGSATSDSGHALAVDGSGDVVLVGRTRTHATDFATPDAAQERNGRAQVTQGALSDDGFAAKLAADGSRVIWATFLGGGAREVALDVDVDGAGDVHVGGSTDSLDFPLVRAAQPTPGGGGTPTPDGQSDNVDAFVTVVRADGGAFLTSTYAGGGEDEIGLAVAVDRDGNAYAAGQTASPDFPTRNPIRPFQGVADAYVAKLPAGGGSFAYSTFVGGAGSDGASGVDVDDQGRAWITGATGSSDFPLADPFQASRTGTERDGFVTALAADGRSLAKSSYLGGSDEDRGVGIAVGADDAVYVTGRSSSSAGFPWKEEIRRSAGDLDAFAAKMSASTGDLVYATHLGGSSRDEGNGIAVTQSGDAVVGGVTESPNFDGATGQGRRGAQDGFVARLAPGGAAPGGPGGEPGPGGPGGGGPSSSRPGRGIPYVYADVIGRARFRPNRPTRFQIVFGNTGGRAGYGVPLWIDGIPADATWNLDTEVSKVTRTGPVSVGASTAAVRHGDRLLLPLVLPAIPADSTGTLQLTITTAREFTLRAWADPPLVPVPVPGTGARAAQNGTTEIPPALKSCFSGVLNYAFDKVVGGVIPDACVNYVADKVLKRVGFEADKFFEDLLGSSDGNWRPRVVSWRQTIIDALQEAKLFVNACHGTFLSVLNIELATGRMLIEMSKALADLQGIEDNAKLVEDCTTALTGGAGATPQPVPGGGGVIGGAYSGTELRSEPSNAIDPNDKAGPRGRFGGGWVTGTEPLRYAIFFENLARATAPAQEIVITDRLDRSRFDLSSVRFGPVGFGDRRGGPTGARPAFTTDIDLRPQRNLIVRVDASMNRATGVATWRLRSLDPITGGLPDDPLAGFLPPNRVPPEGDGYVTLFAKPRPGLRTGTTIRNRASIVFDDNAPILTPIVRNRIDRTPPTSRVTSVRRERGGRMVVRWTGRDRGAGAKRYAVWVSEQGGPFRLVRAATRRRVLRLPGRPKPGTVVVTRATDGAGNAEAPPAVGDLLVPAPRVVARRGARVVDVRIYTAWPGRLTATVRGPRGQRVALLPGSRLGAQAARTTRTSLTARFRRAGRVRLSLRLRRADVRRARQLTIVVRSPRGGPLRIPLDLGGR
jgi:hypothetical protein